MVTPAWSSSGKRTPIVLGIALAGLRSDRVSVGHVARDAAVGALDGERDDVVAARVVAHQRVAAEVGQADPDPRGAACTSHSAGRRASGTWPCSWRSRTTGIAGSTVVPSAPSTKTSGKRPLIRRLERLVGELLEVDRLRELHGESAWAPGRGPGRWTGEEATHPRRGRGRLDEEVQDIGAGAPAELGAAGLVGIEEAGAAGQLALERRGRVGAVGHGEVVIPGRQADASGPSR